MAADRILSARAGRTFYNVADALVPAGGLGSPGAGDVDLMPWVERHLRGRGPRAARRLWLQLLVVEWWGVLSLRARRGFSRQPLAGRRAQLGRWARSRLPALRATVADLDALVREAMKHHSQKTS